MRHGQDATEHDIEWLDDLIQAERRQVRTDEAGSGGNGHPRTSRDARATARRRTALSQKERA